MNSQDDILREVRSLLRYVDNANIERIARSTGISLDQTLEDVEGDELLGVADALLRVFRFERDAEGLRTALASSHRVKVKIRDQIFDTILLKTQALAESLSGRLRWCDFAQRFAPLRDMESTDGRFQDAYGDVCQHMDNNSDWDEEHLLKNYLVLTWVSDQAFFSFLEAIVHPMVRKPDEAESFVRILNECLLPAGFQLYSGTDITGYTVWKVKPLANAGFQAQLASRLPGNLVPIAQRVEELKLAILREICDKPHVYSDHEFLQVRNLLRNHPSLAHSIPDYVLDARTFEECIDNIYSQFTSAETKSIVACIRSDFNPMLDRLDEPAWADDGAYEFLGELGKGGFGVVHKIRNLLIDREFALKIHSPIFTSDEESEALKARFYREAKILFDLTHENIVRIHAIGEHQGRPWIRMELVDGISLQIYCEEHGLMQPRKSAVLALKISNALAAAHKMKIVHRDLKPTNIMVAIEQVKVLDFGLGAYIEEELKSRLTKTGESIAGGVFIAPELHANPRLLDPRSDIYSLGAVWYFALTGMAPVGSDIRRTLKITQPKLSDQYVNTVMKCLANVTERFNSADDAAAAIAILLTQIKHDEPPS